MIIVRITIKVLVEKQKEMMQTLLSMAETAGKEKGCLSYEVFCDINSKTVFHLIEEWETREDLECHIGSSRFRILLGIKSLLAKPMKIKIHTVSRSEGSEVVDALRDRGVTKHNMDKWKEKL